MTATHLPTRNQQKPTRIVWPAVLGIVLIGGATFYFLFWRLRPVGAGPAGPPLAGDSFGEVWSDRKVLLVGMGGTITAGQGASSKHRGYFRRLISSPPDELPEIRGKCLSAVLPNLRAHALAVAVSPTLECAHELVPMLEVQDEDTFGIIVLTIGLDDFSPPGEAAPREGAMYGAAFETAQAWIDDFRSLLEEVLDGLEERFPGGCEFFIANVFDPSDGGSDVSIAGLPVWPARRRILAEYNEIIVRAAKSRRNARLIDLHAAFLGHGVCCRQFWRPIYDRDDPHCWYSETLDAANDRGHDAIRRLFLNEMIATLSPLLRGDAASRTAKKYTAGVPY